MELLSCTEIPAETECGVSQMLCMTEQAHDDAERVRRVLHTRSHGTAIAHSLRRCSVGQAIFRQPRGPPQMYTQLRVLSTR